MELLNHEGLETKGTRRKKEGGNGHAVERPDYEPYIVDVTIEGVAPILFHAYDVEVVEQKASARKGSREKKEDNVESFVYRNDAGELCVPGLNFKAAMAEAAKRFPDPSSPRKSARDLVRAGVLVSPFLASLGTKTWDAIDKRGVVIQKTSRVTRQRPMMREGWRCTFEIEVQESEFIREELLREIVDRAGRFGGLGDYRPDFGRFKVVKWERRKLDA